LREFFSRAEERRLKLAETRSQIALLQARIATLERVKTPDLPTEGENVDALLRLRGIVADDELQTARTRLFELINEERSLAASLREEQPSAPPPSAERATTTPPPNLPPQGGEEQVIPPNLPPQGEEEQATIVEPPSATRAAITPPPNLPPQGGEGQTPPPAGEASTVQMLDERDGESSDDQPPTPGALRPVAPPRVLPEAITESQALRPITPRGTLIPRARLVLRAPAVPRAPTPQPSGQADALRILGRMLDDKAAVTFWVKSEAGKLQVRWRKSDHRSSHKTLTARQIGKLQTSARGLRGRIPPSPGPLTEFLRTVGQDLDDLRMRLIEMVPNQEGLVVTVLGVEGYVTTVYETSILLELSADRRRKRNILLDRNPFVR
jgi:hypothetical protein